MLAPDRESLLFVYTEMGSSKGDNATVPLSHTSAESVQLGLKEWPRSYNRAGYICRLVFVVAALPIFLSQCSVYASTLPNGFTESKVASVEPFPTTMDFSPDGRLFVCQQAGQVQ